MQFIKASIEYNSIIGYTQDNIHSVTFIETTTGKRYYDMCRFTMLYGKSYATLDRYISKIPASRRKESCIVVNRKKFINESVMLQGKHALKYWKRVVELQPKHKDMEGMMVTIDQKDIDMAASNSFTITGTSTDTGILYYDIEQFSLQFNLSVPTIRKAIQRIRPRFRYDFCLSFGYKHYVSPMVLLLLKKQFTHLQNIEYACFLNRYTWSVAGSIRYREYMSAERCVLIMQRLFKKLSRQYPEVMGYFFYVTEQNAGEDGYHSHFVYGNHVLPEAEVIIQIVNKHLEPYGGRYEKKSLVEKFDQNDYFLEYMVKQIHRMPDHYNWQHQNIIYKS